jgi:hypothetical protein
MIFELILVGYFGGVGVCMFILLLFCANEWEKQKTFIREAKLTQRYADWKLETKISKIKINGG